VIDDLIKRTLRRAGVNAVSVDRLGVDVELDLARLTASQPLATIFDVGGNVGQSALRFVAAFPSATVFTFEPVPSTFDRLVEATRHIERIRPFNTGMGDRPGRQTMHLADSSGSNSLVHAGTASGTIDITVDTIDTFADRNGVDAIDLLKIDVEGYELQVLKGAERRLSDGRIRFVYAECIFPPNAGLPHTSFFDLHRVLDAAGFCFATYYAEAFYLARGCAQGNVLYARRSRLPRSAPGGVRNVC
jgi:FkbM family methyltransferase